ncbi:hypothetical protein A6P54_12880 [Bacillus sp. MKU004]|nr:hypothetical protein A6P54_12880 [Bacillus sp. MKU004]
MKKVFVSVIAFLLVFQLVQVKGKASFADKDCGDFGSIQALMDFWYNNGYSASNDPHRLDRDNDGLPCEVSSSEYNTYVKNKSTASTSPSSLNGWKYSNGNWSYYSNGAKHKGWLSFSGDWYYLDSNGFMQTGWVKVSGKWYFFNSSGIMQTSWVSSSGKWYYLHGDGSMAIGWKKVSGQWYYLDTSGVMKTGWVSTGGKWYYLKSSGVMQTGWANVSGEWYFFNSSGVMQTGWTFSGGEWYFLNSSGSMETGWLSSGGNWYFLNTDGVMATGWIMSGNQYYYLYSSGVMAKNTTVDGYVLDESGQWIGNNPEDEVSSFEIPASVSDLLTDYGYSLELNEDGTYHYYYGEDYAGTIGENFVVGSYDYLDMAMSIAEEFTSTYLYQETFIAVEDNVTRSKDQVTIVPDLDERLVTYFW